MDFFCERLTPSLEPALLAQALSDEAYLAWLDTAKIAGPACRYSILAARPRRLLISKGDQLRSGHPLALQAASADPFAVLETLGSFANNTPADFPLPFAGGWIGYFGYDLAPWTEPVTLRATDDIKVPDLCLAWYDAAVIYDHQEAAAWAVGLETAEGRDSAAFLRSVVQRAVSTEPPSLPAAAVSPQADLTSNFTYDQYLKTILAAKEYIAAGDIYQVNISQRFVCDLAISGWDLYRRLRRTNAAPFAAYLRCGEEVELLSSSPERFLRLETDRLVETRPIKGTVGRGATPEEDRRLQETLQSSIKDRAELLMIVDLERNDLGKVCEIGSVAVPVLYGLETYETVHHLVATVHGRLRKEKGPVDLLRASFPGGSITGAPKIRSIEIIDELEPTARAIYTGSVGYLSAHGRMDLNIVIRSFIVRGGQAFYQVGGGIVADSDPHSEYVETLHKGRGLARALADHLPAELDERAQAERK